MKRFGRGTWIAALAPFAAALGCDASVTSLGAYSPLVKTGLYLEAEDGELSGGFTIADDAAASRGRCIVPPPATMSLSEPGAARARYAFDIATRAQYVVWGRIHSPDAVHNTFWFQFDGGTWYQWRITTGEVWWWDRFHDNFQYGTPLKYDFEPGPHELVIANSIDGTRLDRMYITADGDTPPGNDTPCRPPHSVQLDGGCSPSCGSQGGNECGNVQCMGHTILQAYDCEVCCIVPIGD